MNSNNNGCHQSGCDCQQCSNGKINCTGIRPFRAIDAACIPPVIPEPPKEETLVAYGSFYKPDGFNVPVTTSGQKVIFTTPGPSLNVDPAPVPNNTTDLQVAANGVYEISMDITVNLFNSSTDPTGTIVNFALFINDFTLATNSDFESINAITTSLGDQSASLVMDNTIGKTILLRLNKGDRLSIRVTFVDGSVAYRFPTFVVNKIAD
ncbi:hypothetical protein [Lysinibacillus sp. NPDC093688]|uniref:hypothetical protein n=1 Tax=Lysinibacillus sp. NPDC093688 TaxID=3390577 RepID=UPI003D03D3F7